MIQIVDEESFKESCESTLCIVAVLPHILDCQSKCRDDYLHLLKTLGEKFKKKGWGYVQVFFFSSNRIVYRIYAVTKKYNEFGKLSSGDKEKILIDKSQ